MENEFSLNDLIVCDLTPYGVSLLVEHYKKFVFELKSAKSFADKHKIKSGKYEFTIWEFANIFGKDLWNGNENVTINSKFQIKRINE